MTKRNSRTRRHGTNEMAAERKGRVSPTASAVENIEYTMIDLVRSVEKLHFCKSGDRKETVMWSDVKKHYKKTTGRVLSTEAFNKLAGVTGSSRKELIAGPLAGLLVAEDPAALVLRFKYDANKGDPLINHRFYLEASGAKTSVHHANGAVSPTRPHVTNSVSPSPSEEESQSSSSLSPTCISSISTDPDTEAFSPMSASSPLSSAPLSPTTQEYVTAADEQTKEGDQSFLTARTSPMTSDWETSSSSRDTATPDGSPHNSDQEKTLGLLDMSNGAAETTIGGGASEVLVDMDTSVKEESVRAKEEEEEKVEKEEEKREHSFEDGSDKENHLETAPVTAAKPAEEAAAGDVAVEEEHLAAVVIDEAIDVPEAVQEVEVATSPHPEDEQEEEEEVMSEPTPVVESAHAAVAVEEQKEEVEEVKGEEEEVKKEEAVEEKKEEAQHDLASGDGPVPLQPEFLQQEAAASAVEECTTTTTSSSDETLLTVIERAPPALPTLPPPEEEKEEVEDHSKEKLEEEKKEEEVMEVREERKEEEEVVGMEKKAEEQSAGDSVPAAEADAAVADAIVDDMVVEESVVKVEDKGEEEEEEERTKTVKREASPVEEVKEVEQPIVKQPEVEASKEEEEKVVEESVEKSEPSATEVCPAPVATEETGDSTTEEPTATTMVSAATVAPLQQVQQPQPVLTSPPPPPSHEPMETISLNSYSSSSSTGRIDRPPSPTSDDVDMNDVLAGGPAKDVPSVTAPITLQPKPASRAQPEEDDDSEIITSQPVMDESDAVPHSSVLSAVSPKDDGPSAASPDDLALRRAAPAKKFPCCTIV